MRIRIEGESAGVGGTAHTALRVVRDAKDVDHPDGCTAHLVGDDILLRRRSATHALRGARSTFADLFTIVEALTVVILSERPFRRLCSGGGVRPRH
jgi:hypothetical protein